MALSDVQSRKPEANFKLTRVGIKGVKKPVCIKRKEKVVNLIATIDLFVDLPATRKGSDLSRNAEIIEEIVDISVREPSKSLEDLCEKIAGEMLSRHEYANRTEVRINADYFLERRTPGGKKSLEPYKIMAVAVKERGGGVKKFIGVEVVGMTVCPCAMENIRATYGENYSHNQRNIASVFIENDGSIDADDIISIIEKSMSAPTFEILKRGDETEIVKKAHENPKFVEDVVRDILKEIVDRYKELPDSTVVIARSESFESIHKHNAFAERITTLGELRK